MCTGAAVGRGVGGGSGLVVSAATPAGPEGSSITATTVHRCRSESKSNGSQGASGCLHSVPDRAPENVQSRRDFSRVSFSPSPSHLTPLTSSPSSIEPRCAEPHAFLIAAVNELHRPAHLTICDCSHFLMFLIAQLRWALFRTTLQFLSIFNALSFNP